MQKPLYLIFIELLGQEILTSTIYLFRFSIFFLIVFLDITKDNVKGQKILAYDNVFENIVIQSVSPCTNILLPYSCSLFQSCQNPVTYSYIRFVLDIYYAAFAQRV